MQTILLNFKNVFDLYGVNFPLRYHCHEHHHTTLGGIISILSLISILILSIFFLEDLFTHSTVSVVSSEEQLSYPLIDLSKVPFLFSLGDSSGSLIGEDDNLFTFTLQLNNYSKYHDVHNNITSTRLITKDIQIETCNLTKHFKGFESLFPHLNASLYKCIVPGQNLILFNRFGDTNTGFQILNLYIDKCDTKHTKTCLPFDTITRRLSNSYLNFIYGTYDIDHYNYTTPIQKTIRSELFRFSSSITKRYFYKLSQSHYITDIGLVYNQLKQENFFEFNSFYIDVDVKDDMTVEEETSLGTITVNCYDSILWYKRTYPKAQTVIASIGSLTNLIFFICQVIVKVLTKRMIMMSIVNDIFFSKEKRSSEKENEGKEKEKGNAIRKVKSEMAKIRPSLEMNNFFKNNLKMINDKHKENEKNDIGEQLNYSHDDGIKHYKLKIKKKSDNDNKNDVLRKINLNIMEMLTPNVFSRKNKKMRLFNNYEMMIYQYLSIENIIPFIKKSQSIIEGNNEIIRRTKIRENTNESLLNFMNNPNHKESNNWRFPKKFTFGHDSSSSSHDISNNNNDSLCKVKEHNNSNS